MSSAGRATAAAAVIGAAIWASSQWITGHVEPWDAPPLFYFGLLAAGGLVSGTVVPRPLWAHYVGSVLGQALYVLLFLPVGPLFPLGLAFMLGFSLFFLLGAGVGLAIRHHLAKARETPD